MISPDGYATSLILSGGGSYSAYEVGVMKALFEGKCSSTDYIPFNPDLLVGTSAGAMNVAVLAAQEVRTGSLLAAVAEMQSIWADRLADGAKICGNGVYRIRGLPFRLFDPECLRRGPIPFLSEALDDASVLLRGTFDTMVNFFDSSDSPLKRVARLIDLAAFISVEPFLESLQAILPLEDFARSTRSVRIVTLDLTAGQMKLFTEADVRRLGYLPLLAASAIPIFFPTQQIEGHDYINGSTLAATPLLPVLEDSDVMHIVYMDPEISTISPIRLDDIIDAMDRLLVVNFAYMLNRDIQFAQELNTALELIEQGFTIESLSVQNVHALLRSFGRIQDRLQAGNPYRPLTIHRYHPRDDLGGDLGQMNLDHKRIIQIIDRGYADTVAHDCVTSGCVLPGRPAAKWPQVAVQPVVPVESPPIRR